MRIDTVKIRNPRTGEVRKINAIDRGSNLGIGKYSGWQLVGEAHGDKPAPDTVMVSGKSIGVDAQVPLEELQTAEELAAKESAKAKELEKRRRKVKESLGVEVKDKAE